jgi:hypothetical protein
LGFSDEMGLAWLGQPDAGNLPEMLSANTTLAAVVKADLDAAYEAALALMENAQEQVSDLATALALPSVLTRWWPCSPTPNVDVHRRKCPRQAIQAPPKHSGYWHRHRL